MQFPYTIRQAREQDLPAILSIEHRSFDEQTREDRETFRCRIQAFKEGFLLLEDEMHTVVGYCCCELWDNLPGACGLGTEKPETENTTDLAAHFALGHDASAAHKPNGTVLYISSIALLPEHRGSGTGRRFLQQSLDRVLAAYPQITDLVLLVNTSWPAARHLYETLGFQQYGTIPGFFHDGDGILMKRAR